MTQSGEQSGNIGRVALLAAGWPTSVPSTTVDRKCGSSQQAVAFAAAGVISGQYDFAVAGGVESMSRVQMGSNAQGQAQYPDSVLERFGVRGLLPGHRRGTGRRQVGGLLPGPARRILRTLARADRGRDRLRRLRLPTRPPAAGADHRR